MCFIHKLVIVKRMYEAPKKQARKAMFFVLEKPIMFNLPFNSLRPSDAYMRQCNIPPLLQIMACRLFGAKPLSEAMLEYC